MTEILLDCFFSWMNSTSPFSLPRSSKAKRCLVKPGHIVLPLYRPLIEEMGQGSYCIPIMAPIFLYLWSSSSLVPTTKLNRRLWSYGSSLHYKLKFVSFGRKENQDHYQTSQQRTRIERECFRVLNCYPEADQISHIQFEYVTRVHHKHSDALATFCWRSWQVDWCKYCQKDFASHRRYLSANPFNEQDWQSSNILILIRLSSTMAVKDSKDFIIING